VDPKALEDTFLELRLKLQVKSFHPSQVKDYFFKPYAPEAPVSVAKLRDVFEFNGFPDKKSELLARYLIEPRDKAQVDLDLDRAASQRHIIALLEESIGHYKVYQSGDSQPLLKRIQKLLLTCRDTLKETLELEDYEEDGAIPYTALKEAFVTLELDLGEELLDFILYVLYQKSESLEKLRYPVLFDLLDGKLPGLNATSSEGGRKRPESSSPEKLKARNKEKFSEVEAAAKGAANERKEDEYEEEFEQLLDKDDEEAEEHQEEAVGRIKKDKDDYEDEQYEDDDAAQQKAAAAGKNEEDDDYIDEEEMLDIAEKCFVRIAEAILENGVSVRHAFSPFIIREEFEGEALELLSPIGFLEGVKELGVTDLEEVEVACLMRVLTKADLENAILLRELIVIMENFGIQDDGAQEDTNPDASSSAKKPKKKKGE
jgi:hypothetical protein